MDYLLQAFGMGLLLSIMVGPVFFLLMETSITKGIKAALYLDFGVFLSDLFYIVIAMFFAFQLNGLSEAGLKNNIILGFIGGVVFTIYGAYCMIKKVDVTIPKIDKASDDPGVKYEWVLIFKGFMINFVNPAVAIYWLAVLAKGFDLVEKYDGDYHIAIFIFVVLFTYFGIDVLKILGANKLKPYVTDKLLKSFNILLGIIFVLTGIILMLRQIVL